MNILNINVPKDSISMIFDAFQDVENYSTTLYLHKSKIISVKDKNPAFDQLEIDLKQDDKKDKMVKKIFNKEYGSFLINFLNADFSNAKSAYYSFFVYYGVEGFDYSNKIREKYPIEYTSRYVSTKNFLDYYNKAFEFDKDKYIKFQKSMRYIVDFVFNLHNIKTNKDLEKYPKFIAVSNYTNILKQTFGMVTLIINQLDEVNLKNIEQIEKLAYDISIKKKSPNILYRYEGNSHLTLAYIALNDLIQNSRRNINVCQNCGRYFLQYSGKEVYCDLFNLDGSPVCRTYASRKTYENKILEDEGELAYKREYQRRITRVYRADKEQKEKVKEEQNKWKNVARKQLKEYRDGKISKGEFIAWIEKNK